MLSEIATKRQAFRVVEPTATQTGELLRLYTPIINRWRDSAARSMNAYAVALSTGDLTGLSEEDKETAAEIAALLALIDFGSFFGRMELWHRAKWLSSVAAATGVDATYLVQRPIGVPQPVNRQQRRTAASGVVAAARAVTVTSEGLAVTGTLTGIDKAVADAVAANVALVRSVSDDTRARIANAVISGVRQGKAATEVAREINKGLVLSKKRADRIAENQVDAAITAMTKARAQEAGIETFEWRHYTERRNARLNHLFRNGKTFRWDNKSLDALPGVLPNCRCRANPVI